MSICFEGAHFYCGVLRVQPVPISRGGQQGHDGDMGNIGEHGGRTPVQVQCSTLLRASPLRPPRAPPTSPAPSAAAPLPVGATESRACVRRRGRALAVSDVPLLAVRVREDAQPLMDEDAAAVGAARGMD